MNSSMDTIGQNPLRYSVGDNNNNNEVSFIFQFSISFFHINEFV